LQGTNEILISFARYSKKQNSTGRFSRPVELQNQMAKLQQPARYAIMPEQNNEKITIQGGVLMRNKLNVGIVGMGNRGCGLMEGNILKMPDIEVVSVCDTDEDNLNLGVSIAEKMRGKKPQTLKDYNDLIALPEVDVCG